MHLWFAVTLLAAMIGAACAPAERGPGPGGIQASQAEGAATGTKRVAVVVPNEPPVLYYPLAPLSTRSGGGIFYNLLHPGVAVTDNEYALRPLLVEEVPSLTRGNWRVQTDGTMTTTWQLRQGALWHDGAPVTSADLAFTLAVVRDRELGALRNKNYDLIASVETPDSRTITINWSRPYIDADRAFTYQGTIAFAVPMPKHLLESAYAGNRAGFLDLPYWSTEFIGFGPFKLDRWTQGSHITLTAFDRYVLGRPKVQEIEARFIPDQNTIISNVLAGSLDVFSGAAIGVDQALQLREQWKAGQVNIIPNNWAVVYPQHLNPQPAIVQNVEFRRALLHAIDRQAMADTLMYGLVPVTDSPLDPNSREYKATEASLVRYPFDQRRAVQLIEGLGFVRGGDGTFRDPAGQPLSVEIRGAATRDIHVKGLFPIVDNWQKVGLAAEPVVISAQQASDLQDQATFKAFQLVRQDYHLNRLISYHTSEARLPERNFTGSNNGRYMSPELDALIDRYLVTVPWEERMQIAGQILHHITDQVVAMPLFYDMEVALVSHRVQNAVSLLQSGTGQVWNGHEWDTTR
jgi:peptide/nickel transport system substrate-binding protein